MPWLELRLENLLSSPKDHLQEAAVPVWLKWLGIVFLGLAAILGGLYWWFFLESHVPKGAFKLDIADIRSLANSIKAEKPVAVHVEHVTSGEMPLAAGVAGGSWSASEMPFQAYQIVYTSAGAMIVDTTMDKKTASGGGGPQKFYDNDAYERVLKAMDSAARIMVTHEHFDHLGGLASAPNVKMLMGKALLTKEQLNSTAPAAIVSKIPAEALLGYTPLSYEGYYVAGPGVVLIKAPGHTPGSQMVFVQLQDGTEYLFLGDVAWKMANVDLMRERPRAVAQFFLQEDRAKVALQLAAIKAVKDANPSLHIVPGHDRAVLDKGLAEGWLKKGFQ
jgi:glyoxylase-like metal-dependent hydrolase (beta-lactamase superfamily II)